MSEQTEMWESPKYWVHVRLTAQRGVEAETYYSSLALALASAQACVRRMSTGCEPARIVVGAGARALQRWDVSADGTVCESYYLGDCSE